MPIPPDGMLDWFISIVLLTYCGGILCTVGVGSRLCRGGKRGGDLRNGHHEEKPAPRFRIEKCFCDVIPAPFPRYDTHLIGA